MLFEGEFRFTKEMVAKFFEIDVSTVDRYLSQYETELKHNGYVLSKGKQLKECQRCKSFNRLHRSPTAHQPRYHCNGREIVFDLSDGNFYWNYGDTSGDIHHCKR